MKDEIPDREIVKLIHGKFLYDVRCYVDAVRLTTDVRSDTCATHVIT